MTTVDGADVRAGIHALTWTATCIQRATEHAHTALAGAAQLVLDRPGRLVVSGLGKSGLIGAKLAATFASTGTVATYVHAADALHGDAGMVAPGDVLLGLSNSGTTPELVAFARLVATRDVPLIALTGCRGTSPLAAMAAVHLDAGVEREADPNDQAPTTSTSVALALGDALAITLISARDFGPDDFRAFHPGGALGSSSGEDTGR